MRTFLFIISTIFFIGCKSNKTKKDESLVIETTIPTLLSVEEKNDSRWIKINNSDCYIFDYFTEDEITFEWEGDCFDGKVNGYGKAIKYLNGQYYSTYEGEYVNGIRKGKGKWEKFNGEIIEGNFFYVSHGKVKKTEVNGEVIEGYYNIGGVYTAKKTLPNGNDIYFIDSDSVSKTEYENDIKNRNDFIYPTSGIQTKYYYDENWESCELKDAKYYRLINLESKYYPKDGLVQDFYISGEIQNRFYVSYIDLYDDNIIYEGLNERFNNDGTRLEESQYVHGRLNYLNKWDENGNLSQQKKYDKGKIIERNYPLNNYKFTYNDSLRELGKSRYLEYDIQGNLIEEGIYSFTSGDDSWYPTGILKKYNNDGSGEEVYRVNFRDKNWKEKLDKIKSINTDETNYLKNNAIEIDYGNSGTLNYIDFESPLELSENFSIETNFTKTSGPNDSSFTGIIFNYKNWDNYVSFKISGNGYYRIDREFEEIDFEIEDWKRSSKINKYNASNTLKILKLGKKIHFSINGEIVKSIDSFNITSNKVGLIMGESNVVYAGLEVKNFLEKEQIVKKKPDVEKPNIGDTEWAGSGSGIIISRDGYIATNYHVIEESKYTEVSFLVNNEMKNYKARIVKSDSINDLAILKIDDQEFENLKELNYNFKLEQSSVGIDVFTLGYPLTDILGGEIKLTDGRISSRTGILGDIREYQHTAPLQPGNSGGPLFDFNGNLIGINTATIKKEIAENVSYSIKTIYLKNLIDVLSSDISLPVDDSITDLKIEEQVKILSNYTVFIKVK
ncbi:trypsin-like peptidase domain-containing protein [Polaribacter sp.]|nr:trypsin-like peptidase domain-containing protein [Polaribacter sp.]